MRPCPTALLLDGFKKELLSFPFSKHDDQIDALSQALQRRAWYWAVIN
jgi:phage terminase large subunit-like protein